MDVRYRLFASHAIAVQGDDDMATLERSGIITHIDRMWMLAPFKKTLSKRQHEVKLLDNLDAGIQQLFRDPRSPGLNLEKLNNTGKYHILSARLNQDCRVILVQLAKTEVGLLYFGSSHDEAYRWVDRNRLNLQTMLAKDEEIVRNSPLTAYVGSMPVIQRDEDAPIALQRAEQFREMVAAGIERYLTHLDSEQQALVNLNVKDLLLVKGGAGTGKTAVAIHRLKRLADQPLVPGIGAEGVLYLCFSNPLARAVTQLLEALYGGVLPPAIRVSTFHSFCGIYLRNEEGPTVKDDACQQEVYKAFGRLAPEHRAALGDRDGSFADEEIVQVIKHNGLTDRDQYLQFERKGRGSSIKRPAREAIWEIHERAREEEARLGICRFCDLPLFRSGTMYFHSIVQS